VFSITQQRWTLLATILASGVVQLDGSIINVALSSIDRDLNAGLAGLQWIVAGYALTLSSFMILGGALSDRYGRKRVLMIGLLCFGISSLVCGFAASTPLLVIARIVQGIAGALLVPGALAILRSVYTDEKARASAIGIWTAFTGIAAVIGPLMGGWFVEHTTWRWVFLINGPLIAVTIALFVRFVPETQDENARGSLDWTGGFLTVLGLTLISAALIQAPLIGLSSLPVMIGLVSGIAILIGFVFHQARTPNPMMPLSLFKSRNYSSINLATLGIYFALGGAPFFVPMFLQNVLEQSPIVSGAVLLPMPLMLFAFAQKFGSLAAKHGSRWIIFAGAVVCVVGQLILAQVSYSIRNVFEGLATDEIVRYDCREAGNQCLNGLELFINTIWGNVLSLYHSILSRPSYESVTLIVLAAFVIGLGLSMLVAPLTSVVLSSLPAKNAGVGTAVNYVAAKVAGLFAVAGLGLVFSSVFTSNLDSKLAQISPDPSLKAKLEVFKSNPSARAEPGLPLVRGAQTEAFKMVMLVCAGLTLAGGVAALFVRDGVLPESDSSLI
jgi:EmrB/QacA subfamily drug resistance transporter